MSRTRLMRSPEEFHGAEAGRPCLIVLGGPSGANWRQTLRIVTELEEEPPFVISCNGAEVPEPDYYLSVEPTAGKKAWFHEQMKLVCPKFIDSKCIAKEGISTDRDDIIPVTRKRVRMFADTGPEMDWDPRSYNGGLPCGDAMRHTEAVVHEHSVGTVGLQAIGLGTLLGSDRLHTVGWDLRVLPDEPHHWYEDADYKVNNGWWNPSMRTEYAGVDTFWYWVETAQYMLQFQHLILGINGISWRDHSDIRGDQGLLRRIGAGNQTRTGGKNGNQAAPQAYLPAG